jgi:hypothetical protein
VLLILWPLFGDGYVWGNLGGIDMRTMKFLTSNFRWVLLCPDYNLFSDKYGNKILEYLKIFLKK